MGGLLQCRHSGSGNREINICGLSCASERTRSEAPPMTNNSLRSDQGNRETVAVFASDRAAFWPLPISDIRRGGSDNGSNDITRLGF